MWQQRIHTMYAEERRNGGPRALNELDAPANRSWRPFQLAFLLLNLAALTTPLDPARSAEASATADLLWFPTGGGKTEAYLGLTAYTLAMRRLQGEVAGRSGLDGVAVIMRYTLRLLTLQQFQHAAALICASDPLCAEHALPNDLTLHGAACHACLFAPETSCERGNRYLDRSVLIATVDRGDLAFFREIIG